MVHQIKAVNSTARQNSPPVLKFHSLVHIQLPEYSSQRNGKKKKKKVSICTKKQKFSVHLEDAVLHHQSGWMPAEQIQHEISINSSALTVDTMYHLILTNITLLKLFFPPLCLSSNSDVWSVSIFREINN